MQGDSSASQKKSLPGLSPLGQKGDKAELDSSGNSRMTKGRKLWHVLQKGYRHAEQQMRNEDKKVLHLSHGLQHLAHISLVNPVRHITHDALKQHFVVLDSENMLHFLREDGSYKSCQRAPTPMMGLLYATQVDQFVAWTEGGLQVLDSGFHLLSQVQSALPIRCGLYSELLNRIVTAGDRNVTIWDFRYGSRSLQCRLALSEGLGPSDVFSRLALDASGTSPQRCFASCGTGVAVFDITKGKLLSFRKELHSRVITDIAYCEVVGCVVTASRDTTIKVWDENWCIQTVFVGHTAPATAVTIYPRRPLIFSASQDGTIRTWNLDIVDQVDQVHLSEPAEVLEAKTASHVFSISGTSLSLWKVNKLYSLHTLLGVPVKRLSCANLEAVGPFPIRVLCVCQDSSVRLLDAASGAVLSTLCLEQHCQVVSEAYCLPRETLFVLTDDGTLLRINTASDPMVVRKSSQSFVEGSLASCLLLYSHVIEPERAHMMWLEVVENKGEKKQWQKLPLNMQDKNRYLLIMGHRNGLLSSMEWFSGRIECTVEAHGSGQVTALAEYPTQTCIISAGADLTVKMWRLFPYARECLVPLLCFSSATLAMHMCSLGATLAVAFQDPETVTYSIVYYNLMEQTRTEHGPEDDPLDDITSLCCCPHLKIFASASRDGSVKIWDIRNQLLRHLKLNTIPESLAFANHKGDLLVGIERHLYLIHHNKYLPSYYTMKLLCAKFLEPIKDVPLPISDACFEELVQDNIRRLMHEPPLEEAGSPLPGAPQVATQDSKAIRDTKAKAEELAQLARQAQDLQLLQKGKVRAAKKPRSLPKEKQEEAFERYLRIFYKEQPRVEIPAEDTFNADEVLEAMRQVDSISELYGPHSQFLGAFPQPSTLKTFGWMLQDASSPADLGPWSPSAVLPPGPPGDWGSPFLQGKDQSEQEKAAGAPVLEKRVLELPSKERRVLSLQLLQPSKETSQPFLSPDMDEARSPSPVASASPPSPRGPLRLVSAVVDMARLSWEKVSAVALVRQADAQTDLKAIEDSGRSAPPSPSLLSMVPSVTADDIVRSDDKSLAIEEPPRAVGSQESLKQFSSPSLSWSQASSGTIRDFFLQQPQSRDQLQLPPDSSSLLMPRVSSGFIPNSVVVQQFPSQALDSSRTSSRTSSARRLSTDEQPQEETGEEPAKFSQSSIKGSIPRIFLTQLDEFRYAERKKEIPFFALPFKDKGWFKKLFPEGFPAGMSLIEFLIQLLESLLTADLSTKIMLLGAIMFLQEELWGEMPKMVCDTLFTILHSQKELLSIQDRSQKRFILTALHVLVRFDPDSQALMVELMSYYLQAPISTRAAIKNMIKEVGVEDPHSYFYQEMDSWQVEVDAPHETVREICCQWLEGMSQELQEWRDLGVAEEPPERQSSFENGQETEGHDQHQVDFQALRPVDAIHYFIERQLERELEVMRQLVSASCPEETPKDTVMALPPVQKGRAILRLGETNTMLRRRVPKRSFCFPCLFSRYVMKGFAPFVKLPLPKISLDPFPPRPQKPASPPTFTAAQQMVQKYFIPKFSCADSYP
ncbi:WD repeat-containing protein 97 [Tiliqua scincoides]|uniref:WD repeat-containing protein 97 n=1 Tax=Tiliqua scincoides TaxID=71010 RepID=UPI0034627322